MQQEEKNREKSMKTKAGSMKRSIKWILYQIQFFLITVPILYKMLTLRKTG